MKIGVVSRVGEFPEKEWEEEFATFGKNAQKATHLELIVNYPFFGSRTYTEEQTDLIRQFASMNGLDLILHLLPNQYQLPEGVRYADSPEKFQRYEEYLKTKVFNIASADERVSEFSIEEVKRTISMAEKLGARLITIHGGSFSEGDYENSLERARKTLEHLNAASGDVKICVENLPTLGHFGKPPRELPIYAAGLVYLVSGLDNIGICFDIGHANTVGNPLEFYRQISKTGKVWDMHLHDNKGDKDDHLQLGRGNIDWREFLKELRRDDYSGYLSIELDTWNETPEPMKKEERKIGLAYIRK